MTHPSYFKYIMLLHYPIIRASDPLCFPQQSFTDAVLQLQACNADV